MKLRVESPLSREIKNKIVKVTDKAVAFYPEESVVDIVGGTEEDIEKLTDAKISTKRVDSKK